MSGVRKQLTAIKKALSDEGVFDAAITKGRAGHFRIEIPGYPKPLFTSSTPSDYRAIKNFQARVRRAIKEVSE